MRRTAVLGSLALCLSTVACASHEPPPPTATTAGSKTETTKTDPEPEPPREPVARAAIASVQLIEDCPAQDDGSRPPPAAGSQAQPRPASAQEDPGPAADMPPHEAKAARSVAAGSAIAGGDGWRQPCTQSTMQLVLAGQGDQASTVEIEAVRLLDPKSGTVVATLKAREPAAWADGAYLSWNQTIGPRQEVKASYALSVPDWSAVEAKIGTGSSGFMFVLEVDVKVGDERQTVRSAQFPREMPHIMVT